MAQKKIDGTFNCALCDKPRKKIDVYTLCRDHMEEWYKLALRPITDVEFREFNRMIGENLI